MDKCEKIKELMVNFLTTTINILELQLIDNEKENEIKVYKKLIRDSKTSINIVKNIQHKEIVYSLYNTFISGKEVAFTLTGTIIKKNVKRWDTTKSGFEEFLKLEKEAQEEHKARLQQEKESRDAIEQAKKEGKKIEFIMKNGKLVPTILDDKQA